MPWRKLDPWFFLLAWSSWIIVAVNDLGGNNPDNSIPGLITALYPFFLSTIFLIPGGWYLYESKNKKWKRWHYPIYLAIWALGWFAFFSLDGLAIQYYQVSIALGYLGSSFMGMGVIGLIPTHIYCIKRFREPNE